MKVSSHLKTIFMLMLVVSLLDSIEGKKKKAKKGQNPPKKKEKVPEKPKLRLVNWFGNMSDITYRCPATEYPNYKKIVSAAKFPILTVADCSVEGSRWDYDIKILDVETLNRRDAFNGHGLLTFARGNEQGKFKQGLKLGKCFLLSDDKIREIRGNFVDNVLQGNVTIQYRNESIVVGQVSNSRLVDIVRRFDRNEEGTDLQLQTIETADGRILWRRVNEIDAYLFDTQYYNNNTFRTIMTEDFKNIYECWENNRYYFSHCYKLQSHLPVMQKSTDDEMSCNTTIGEQKRLLDKVALHSVEGIHTIMYFWYNSITRETWEKDSEKFPHCVWNEPGKGVSIWNSNNTDDKPTEASTNLKNWLDLMASRDKDPYWFHAADPSDGPWIDNDHPELNITIKYFVDRPMFFNESIVIKSHNKILYRGRMINGTIRDKLSPLNGGSTFIGNNRTMYDWGAPLQIVIGDPEEEGKPMFDKEDKFGEMKKHKLIVYGRIMENKLDGHVRIFGKIPNDPLDSCGGQKMVEEGLGFIGRYKNGIPVGFCWRGLMGGAWIYGKVDDNGEFTGHNVAYVNQDLKTLFIGTFENGLMVCGRKSEIESERCNNDGIKVMKVSEPKGRFYTYEPPMATSFGNEPNTVDPLDEVYMSLDKSPNVPKHETPDGAFAKIDTPKDTVFSLYSGYLLNKTETETLVKNSKLAAEIVQKEYPNDPAKAQEFYEREWMYRHKTQCEMAIDIPPEFANTELYNATLGHKVNHDFEPNSKYIAYDSARFGIIVAVKTREPVPKGKEFLVHYSYPYQMGPRWYKELFKKSIKKNPNLKKKYAHLLAGVDLEAEMNQGDGDLPTVVAIGDTGKVEPTKEKETPAEFFEKEVFDRSKTKNLLGTTYWY